MAPPPLAVLAPLAASFLREATAGHHGPPRTGLQRGIIWSHWTLDGLLDVHIMMKPATGNTLPETLMQPEPHLAHTTTTIAREREGENRNPMDST
ncbi:unnamed protein product [Arctogadus glacialis]